MHVAPPVETSQVKGETPTLKDHVHYHQLNLANSLSQLVRWMATKAEELGVEIYPGFAASEVIYDGNDKVCGIRTNDMGIAKDGSKRETFQPGVDLKGMDPSYAFWPPIKSACY